MSWTFKLRKGVKFHDGEPFNATAVKLCLERTIKMRKGAFWLWLSIKEIQVIDDYTVKFVLKYPAAIDLISGAMHGAMIYSPKTAAKGFKPGSNRWYRSIHREFIFKEQRDGSYQV